MVATANGATVLGFVTSSRINKINALPVRLVRSQMESATVNGERTPAPVRAAAAMTLALQRGPRVCHASKIQDREVLADSSQAQIR
jgi:hypothetical protein